MSLGDFVVVRVMPRSNLNRTTAELTINILIGNNRYCTLCKGECYLPSNQVGIAGVLRMDRNTGISQHCLGSRSGDYYLSTAVGKGIKVMPELSVDLFMFYLIIRQCGTAGMTPVYKIMAPIYQVPFVQ